LTSTKEGRSQTEPKKRKATYLLLCPKPKHLIRRRRTIIIHEPRRELNLTQMHLCLLRMLLPLSLRVRLRLPTAKSGAETTFVSSSTSTTAVSTSSMLTMTTTNQTPARKILTWRTRMASQGVNMNVHNAPSAPMTMGGGVPILIQHPVPTPRQIPSSTPTHTPQ